MNRDRYLQGGRHIAEFDTRLRPPCRQGIRAARRAIGLSLALVLITAALSTAQTDRQFPTYQGQTAHEQQERTSSNLPGDLPDRFPGDREKQLRALNVQRQKAMVSDAAKLLQLATELNGEVASGNSDSLTPSQLRKVAAIEKLAKSVKEKMSQAVGTGLDDRDPFRNPGPLRNPGP